MVPLTTQLYKTFRFSVRVSWSSWSWWDPAGDPVRRSRQFFLFPLLKIIFFGYRLDNQNSAAFSALYQYPNSSGAGLRQAFSAVLDPSGRADPASGSQRIPADPGGDRPGPGRPVLGGAGPGRLAGARSRRGPWALAPGPYLQVPGPDR